MSNYSCLDCGHVYSDADVEICPSCGADSIDLGAHSQHHNHAIFHIGLDCASDVQDEKEVPFTPFEVLDSRPLGN